MSATRAQLYIVGLFVATLALCAETAHAATYYVAKSGRDANSCGQAQSQSTPKQTVNNAVACLSAGDTLIVRAGVYAESLIRNVPSGTSWANKVSIAAFQGESVTLKPASGFETNVLEFAGSQHYIEVDRINLDASLLADSNIVKINAGIPGHDAHHIRLSNAELIGHAAIVNRDAKTAGVLTTNADGTAIGGHEFINLTLHAVGHNDFSHPFYIYDPDVLIEGCNIYDFSGLGVHLYSGYARPFTGVIVRNNIIHDGRRTGAGQRHSGIIVADGAVGAKIYNNVVYSIPDEGGGAWGIIVYTGTNTSVDYNTVYGNAGEGITVESGASGTVLRNNVSYNSAGGNFRDSGAGTQMANNSFSGVDPKFMNASAGDFHLTAGSPLINAAVPLAGVTTDLARVARPQGSSYDVGAYQYVSRSTVSTPAAPTGLRIVLD